MTDPKRLLEGGDVAAQLLDAAVHEAPRPEVSKRLAATLGLGAGVAASGAGVASAATTATSAATATTATTAATVAANVGVAGGGVAAGGVFAKVAVIAGLVTLGTGTGVWMVRATDHPAPVTPIASVGPSLGPIVPPPNAAASVQSSVAVPLPPSAAPPPPSSPPLAVSAPSAFRETTRPRPEAPVDAVPVRPSATWSTPGPSVATAEPLKETALGREIALVDRARAELRAGRAVESLRLLDEHRRTFPSGVLTFEANVLRAEALRATGDVAGGAALARRLLDQAPSGPHAARLRTLAGENP